MKTIVLHGELGKAFGERWHLDVRTAGEALRAIEANRPGIRAHMLQSTKNGVGYRVLFDEREAGVDELSAPFGREVLHIVPEVQGSKDEAVTIAIGVALIVASGGLGAAPLIGTLSASAIAANIGVGLVLSGAARMLSPTPEQPEMASLGSLGDEQTTSYYFTGPVNRAQQGGPVPIGYGEVIVGSVQISAGVAAENI
jgi:predicted phage tail protein